MKLVFGLLLFSSLSNASVFIADKNPSKADISIDTIAKFYCVKSAHFLVRTCTDSIKECYRTYEWPKTFNSNYKLQVLDNCMTELLIYH